MKVTIIPEDGYVRIDGVGKNLDFSQLAEPLDSNIHAVQWTGMSGVVERKIGGPVVITDLLDFEGVLDLFAADDVPPAPPTLEEAKVSKRAELAAYRYAKETGGFVWAGQTILTDDRSKTLLAGARTAADAALANSETYEINWKSSGGWVVLSAAMIVALSNAVREFVQACFDAEKAHDEAIEGLTLIGSVEAYDVTTGWPE